MTKNHIPKIIKGTFYLIEWQDMNCSNHLSVIWGGISPWRKQNAVFQTGAFD